MTAYVIDSQVSTSANEQDALDLTGYADTLLVTSGGSLLSLDGGNGITASGSSESLVVDGLVYSAVQTGIALGAGNYLNLDGQSVGSAIGVSAANGDKIMIDGLAQGSYGTGVWIAGDNTVVTVNGSAEG